MNLLNFDEKDLPMRLLEAIGLASGSQVLLNVDDLKLLLSGRRTGLIQLHNLESENIGIESMDAKLSLRRNATGGMDLLIHPVYRRPVIPGFLDDNEAKRLEKGEVANLLKITVDDRGNKKEALVEYDPETREYIVSDTERIIAPDMVNGEFLTPVQKEQYRTGKEVQLADGTSLNYAETDAHGIRSNKIALIASVLVDGGLTYVLYKGLNALFNRKRDEKEAEKLSPSYYNALADMQELQTRTQQFANPDYARNRHLRR